MIHPKRQQTSRTVAAHYDELDRFYRAIWGEHVHHGYWQTGRETPEQAAEALIDQLASHLDLAPGQHLCDIGCGYGATAQTLARTRDIQVTGVTISARQAAKGQARPGVDIRLQDWLTNAFPDASFDRAYAIESSEHMPDKRRFFAEAYRTLKPGGRFAICAWLAADAPKRWEIRHLLEPICREGRLPDMGNETDYRALAEQAGFQVLSTADLSANVSRTWRICLRRLAAAFLTQPDYIRFLFDRTATDRIFVVTMLRIMIAYRTRAMRYVLLVCRKP